MADRAGSNKAKNQAMAAAMKDSTHKRGVERMHTNCPLGCGALIAREVEGCKSAQKEGITRHMFSCKGSSKSFSILPHKG